jgi:hypothetical protein
VEANLVGNLYRDDAFSWDVLAGYRYLNLLEDITSGGVSTGLNNTPVAFGGQFFPPPSATSLYSQFRTRNQFNGGQIGARVECHQDRLFASLTGTFGFGVNNANVQINGLSSLALGTPTPVMSFPGAPLALLSNVGNRGHNLFSFVPELDAKVGYQVTSRVTAFVGYNVLCWSAVARPGYQINPLVTTTQVPTSPTFTGVYANAQPQPLFRNSQFWAQGVKVGVEIRF